MSVSLLTCSRSSSANFESSSVWKYLDQIGLLWFVGGWEISKCGVLWFWEELVVRAFGWSWPSPPDNFLEMVVVDHHASVGTEHTFS